MKLVSPVVPLWAKSDPRRQICALTLASILGFAGAFAQTMPSAPAGVSETGAPSFAVLGPEALGLSTAPLDLHLLPDGRILVVAQQELTFGDGVRWEAFRSAEDNPPIFGLVAVDEDGQVYTGMAGGFARVELTAGARWRSTPAEKLPAEAASQGAPLTKVTAFADHWYWYGGNGAIVSWRPGQTASMAGNARIIDRIFTLENRLFISDEGSGRFFRLKADGTEEQVHTPTDVVSEGVICAVPFRPGQLLVGTISAGLKLFDGENFRSFGPPGLLTEGHRITDLCQIDDRFFAAAIDTVGIVFFDREGQTVQVLGRSLDHRLARVRLLKYAPNGVLWALLNEGVARVEFPSPVSHFESLLASGLVFAQPLRHAGQLWIQTDGRVMQGIYDASGRLKHFEDNTPPGNYLFTLMVVDEQLFASNDKGIYVYEKTGWRLILPGILNARIGVSGSTPEGIPYVARGEYGVIRRSGQNYTARRIPMPGLEDSYGVVIDSAGIGWLELGTSRVGRLDPGGGNPVLEILGIADGVATGWIEIYLLDGIARFHVGTQLYRFDDAAHKFVVDRELLARIPQLANAGGRPVTDRFQRLWFTVNGATQVIDRSAAGSNRPLDIPTPGFAPTNYTVEDDGVVWMFERRRLARMDLRLPRPPDRPLRALITSVELSASNRHFFAPVIALAPLTYTDNSLVIHFAAPANPFAMPITFEVLLEGAGTEWVSTGAVGSARFNRLKEGDYTFRVRPVAGRTVRGAEARLQFSIRPPWYRTPLAWTIYGIATVSLFLFVTWLTSYLQRRKNERLEQLVTERTRELKITNAQLGRQIEVTTEKSAALSVSEERYRLLNTELEDRVQKRTAELEQVHRQLLESSRQAGMAEVATGVLHNVGNVLNSLNVSSTVIADGVRQAKIESLARLATLLNEHTADLGEFLTTDPKGKRLPELLASLARHFSEERSRLLTEITSLQGSIDHIKEIVSRQQAYATVVAIVEPVAASALMDEALQINSNSLARHGVKLKREYQAASPVLVERGKVLQILINLIRNAKYACDDGPGTDKLITVGVEPGAPGFVCLTVRDNGIGIPAENLTRIFGQGFTTRSYGHGFGLHSSALAAKELKGTLTVHSDGPGRGAIFTLALPVADSPLPAASA